MSSLSLIFQLAFSTLRVKKSEILQRIIKAKFTLYFLKIDLKLYLHCVDNQILYFFDFRSGKSSIYKVVFHKMSPTETLFLESTSKIVKEDVTNSSFVQFSVWDFPGQIDIFDPTFNADAIFGGRVHSRLEFQGSYSPYIELIL